MYIIYGAIPLTAKPSKITLGKGGVGRPERLKLKSLLHPKSHACGSNIKEDEMMIDRTQLRHFTKKMSGQRGGAGIIVLLLDQWHQL